MLLVPGGQRAEAQPEAARPLSVEIRDYASVPRARMDAAIARVQAIFDEAELAIHVIVKTRARDGATDETAAAPRPFMTVLLQPDMRDGLIVREPKVLGVAPGAPAGG